MPNRADRPMRASFLLIVLATMSLAACTGAAATAAETDPTVVPPAAGGGTQPGNGGQVHPDEPVTNPPGRVVAPPGDGATHVEPVPGIVNAIPHSIDHISVAPDGRTVTVYWYGGVEACYGLAEVRVERDADGQLVITIFEGSRPALGDFACIEIAMLKATTITLDAPLFVDGSQVIAAQE